MCIWIAKETWEDKATTKECILKQAKHEKYQWLRSWADTLILEYHEKIAFLLLVDVFEIFWNMCLKAMS